MTKLLRALTVLLALQAFAPLAHAKNKKHKSSKSASKSTPGVAKSDLESRVLVRKRAPFIVEERFRGSNVRLNKDGTFSREGELGSYTSQGHWKVKDGKLKMKWNTGEEYGYALTFKGKTPLVSGQKPSKTNHYVIARSPQG